MKPLHSIPYPTYSSRAFVPLTLALGCALKFVTTFLFWNEIVAPYLNRPGLDLFWISVRTIFGP